MLVPLQDSFQNRKVFSNPHHVKHLVPLPTQAFHRGIPFYRHINEQLYKVTTVFTFPGHFMISPEADSSQLSLSNYRYSQQSTKPLGVFTQGGPFLHSSIA